MGWPFNSLVTKVVLMKKTILVLCFTLVALLGVFATLMSAYNWRGKVDLITYKGNEGDTWTGQWEDGQTTEVVELMKKGEFIGELRNRANAEVKNYAIQDNGNKIFDVTYITDEWGRRVSKKSTSKKEERESRDKFVAFFGGGDVLGMGAPYQHTLPVVFENSQSAYKAYNYGFVGSAFHYFLRSLEINKYQKEIPEEEGLFVYVMTEGHFPRTLGKFGHMHEPHMPYYELTEDSKLVYKGTYEEQKPLLTFIKKYAVTALLSRLSDVNEWTFYSDRDDYFVCEVVRKTHEIVEEKYPSFKLIYFLHETIREHDRTVMQECLEKNQIKFVNFMLESYDPHDYETSELDRHPTLAINELIAQMLIEYLNE